MMDPCLDNHRPIMDIAGRMEFAGGSFGLTDGQKALIIRIFETILRIPGVVLLELWWIKFDVAVNEIRTNVLNKGALPHYLETSTIIEFIDNRNMDAVVAGILSFAGLFSILIYKIELLIYEFIFLLLVHVNFTFQ